MLSSSQQQQTPLQANQLQVRRMRDADIPGIMEIEAVSFGRHHWSEESFLNEMKNQLGRYYSLLDTESNKIVGYCGYWLIFDEAHITTVAIHPQYRGNSLGEILLIQSLDRCMGHSVKWLTLEVRVSNYKAQNLYYKYGFQSVGIRAKYYQDNNEDAMIMTTSNILSESYRAMYNKNKAQLMARLGGLPDGFGQ